MKKKKLHAPEMVFQGEIAECGLACITMLLNTLGTTTSLAGLRQRWPVSQAGASLATLVNILGDYGHTAWPVTFNVQDINKLPVPCILHYGGNHYVYVYSRHGKYFQVLNPATGCFMLSGEELAASATGYAVILEECVYHNTATSGAIAPSQSWLSTLKFPGMVKRCGGGVVLALFGFVLPILFASVAGNHTLIEQQGGNSVFLGILALFGFVSLLQYSLGRWGLYAALNAAQKYSPYIFGKLFKKNTDYFEKRPLGDIRQRFSSINSTILQREQTLNGKYCALFIAVVTLAIMAVLHIWLMLFSLATMFIYGIASYYFAHIKKNLTQQLEESGAIMESFTLEAIKGVLAIRAGDLREKMVVRYNDIHRYTLGYFEKLSLVDLRQTTCFSILGNIDTVLFLWIAFYSINNLGLAYTTVIAFYFFRKIALDNVSQFYQACVALKLQKVADERIKDMLNYQEIDDTAAPASFTTGFQIHNLAFGYDARQPVLDNVALAVNKGDKVALTGVSGSGKSTLLKVMAGLYPTKRGTFYLDNTPVDTSALNTLYANMYYLPQEPLIFEGTLYENLVWYSGNQADENTCRALLEQLGLLAVIDALPCGLATRMSSSNTLFSSGQLQRLMVCRALLSAKPILLLDEPTANLDATSAELMFSTLLSSDKTLLIATHDNSALANFDQVLQVSDGRLSAAQQY
ncbi:peptidase domain-containing ABC transporter [Mangrovibacter plantisponsor]|uniref:ABC-type bacteriocin/lantibiotic exporter with double-glycine peptidase domain n=1 Tax=Mangrovibacter plantisponsor TaxID=451513 RepID=A0A317PYI2_9ENTR|nr:ATP-binding cassette domain-containing protein [Mangrovibacter plantisponsor]PWW07060.1 ABC-type bacteriocin/lantibiotic exporter with double-glycine peptidase domain [Mangrovibacter plantisponsor]